MKLLELYFSQLVGVTVGKVLGLWFSCHQVPSPFRQGPGHACAPALYKVHRAALVFLYFLSSLWSQGCHRLLR